MKTLDTSQKKVFYTAYTLRRRIEDRVGRSCPVSDLYRHFPAPRSTIRTHLVHDNPLTDDNLYFGRGVKCIAYFHILVSYFW